MRLFPSGGRAAAANDAPRRVPAPRRVCQPHGVCQQLRLGRPGWEDVHGVRSLPLPWRKVLLANDRRVLSTQLRESRTERFPLGVLANGDSRTLRVTEFPEGLALRDFIVERGATNFHSTGKIPVTCTVCMYLVLSRFQEGKTGSSSNLAHPFLLFSSKRSGGKG